MYSSVVAWNGGPLPPRGVLMRFMADSWCAASFIVASGRTPPRWLLRHWNLNIFAFTLAPLISFCLIESIWLRQTARVRHVVRKKKIPTSHVRWLNCSAAHFGWVAWRSKMNLQPWFLREFCQKENSAKKCFGIEFGLVLPRACLRARITNVMERCVLRNPKFSCF